MKEEKLLGFMAANYNCAQSVLCYFAERLGLDEELAMKIATGFEMGMYESSTCGALMGGILALNLKFGSLNFEERIDLSKKIALLKSRFEEEMKYTVCEDLLQMRIFEGNNLQKAMETGLLEMVCKPCVICAVTIVEDLIEN